MKAICKLLFDKLKHFFNKEHNTHSVTKVIIKNHHCDIKRDLVDLEFFE